MYNGSIIYFFNEAQQLYTSTDISILIVLI